MKNVLENFFDFITGGFFNVIGAFVRMPFTKKKYIQLLQEPVSNYLGMAVFTVIILLLFLYFRVGL